MLFTAVRWWRTHAPVAYILLVILNLMENWRVVRSGPAVDDTQDAMFVDGHVTQMESRI